MDREAGHYLGVWRGRLPSISSGKCWTLTGIQRGRTLKDNEGYVPGRAAGKDILAKAEGSTE